MKKSLIFLILAGILVFLPVNAEASLLRLSAEPATYIWSNPDPWLRWSWYTGPGQVTINVENKYKVKEDKYLNTIKDIYLVAAISEATKNSGLMMKLGSDTFTAANFTNNGKHPSLPKHGVFGNDTYYLNYFLGDLAPRTSFDLDMSADMMSPGLVHFDAFGRHVYKKYCCKHKCGCGCGYKCGYKTKCIHNPCSRDVNYQGTLIPEPASMGLLGMGLLGFAIRRKRKA